MPAVEIKTGSFYTNGQYGDHWSVRQVVDADEQVTYKVVVGKGRRTRATCTRDEFARWAQAEVFRNENSWFRVDS